jgi:hypothetical protein
MSSLRARAQRTGAISRMSRGVFAEYIDYFQWAVPGPSSMLRRPIQQAGAGAITFPGLNSADNGVTWAGAHELTSPPLPIRIE